MARLFGARRVERSMNNSLLVLCFLGILVGALAIIGAIHVVRTAIERDN